jgi:hypothetical protein
MPIISYVCCGIRPCCGRWTEPNQNARYGRRKRSAGTRRCRRHVSYAFFICVIRKASFSASVAFFLNRQRVRPSPSVGAVLVYDQPLWRSRPFSAWHERCRPGYAIAFRSVGWGGASLRGLQELSGHWNLPVSHKPRLRLSRAISAPAGLSTFLRPDVGAHVTPCYRAGASRSAVSYSSTRLGGLR